MNQRKFQHFFDGAFGTYYFESGGIHEYCELANLDEENLVRKIHREYIAAGATAIKTNTFGANSFLLDGRHTEEIIKKALRWQRKPQPQKRRYLLTLAVSTRSRKSRRWNICVLQIYSCSAAQNTFYLKRFRSYPRFCPQLPQLKSVTRRPRLLSPSPCLRMDIPKAACIIKS